MIFMIDIDNTICLTVKDSEGNWDYPNAKPIYARIGKINDLYEQGHTIIYWTARGTSSGLEWTELTQQQIDSWGCMYHEVRLGKPSYDIWVDDKAFNDKHFFGYNEGYTV